jgi:plasmid stabilization system protein ParE
MSQVRVTHRARKDLDEWQRRRTLPDDAVARLRAAIEPLERFPELGVALTGRWSGYRLLLGPWRWMLVVYRVDADGVTIMTIQDARRSVGPKADEEDAEGRDAP